ncbi:unnamed protein product [Amoebophrya sp. A120]|nr:unnamed protein product [Amoebophrya sp. A120]|eukprot:GSA120T00020421001.1
MGGDAGTLSAPGAPRAGTRPAGGEDAYRVGGFSRGKQLGKPVGFYSLTDRVKEAARKFAVHLMQKSRKRFIQLPMLGSPAQGDADADAPHPLLVSRSSCCPTGPRLLSNATTTGVQQFDQNGGEHQSTGTRIAATSRIISDYVGPLDESFQYFLRRLEAVLKRPDLQSAEMATNRTLLDPASSYTIYWRPRRGANLLPSGAPAYFYRYDRRIVAEPTPHFRLVVEAGGPGVDLSNEAKDKLAWDTKWQWHAVVRDADSGQHRTIVPAPGEDPSTWADRTANAISRTKTRRVILPDAPELFVCGRIIQDLSARRAADPMMENDWSLSLEISEAFDGKLCTA